MEEKTIINSITCDEGSEFTNLQFRKFCRDKNIEIYFTKNDKYKLGIVNRFHRTLKDKLREISETDPKFRWIDHIIDKVILDYNKAPNQGIPN
jgi:transposase InsO family protein